MIVAFAMPMVNAVIEPISEQAQEYQHLIIGLIKNIWIQSFANELSQLAQYIGTQIPRGTDNSAK